MSLRNTALVIAGGLMCLLLVGVAPGAVVYESYTYSKDFEDGVDPFAVYATDGTYTQNAKGVYTINKKLCVGCGKCKDACPFGVLVKVEEAPNASKCIACGICAKACPMDAIQMAVDDAS